MKISVVTPCFNGVEFIKEAIESVVSQKGEFELEYIIVDGGSTDGTVDILREYSGKYDIKWVSEPDDGMYDAVNKGFSMATGDICAWINSDDIYYEDAFKNVLNAFQANKEVDWIIGVSNTIDESSNILIKGNLRFYNREWIQKGYYGAITAFISQESVFFRKSLWNKIRKINTELKLAGDYWLWREFAQHAHLYSLDYLTSAFRKRRGQLSSDFDEYLREAKLTSGVDKNSFRLLHYFTKYEGHYSERMVNLFFRLFNRKAKYIDRALAVRETFNFYRSK